MTPLSRDKRQEYIQSGTDLGKDVYVKASKKLYLPINHVFNVAKNLYGITVRGLDWNLS